MLKYFILTTLQLRKKMTKRELLAYMPPPLQEIITNGYYLCKSFKNCLLYLIHWLKVKTSYYKKTYSDPKNPKNPKSPQNPWAFIRVCNEKETLKQSLESIVGAISRGVIVYNECTDGSEEIIKDFCSKHQGFKCIEYPYQVARCHCSKIDFKNKKTLADYYNFALSFIPQGEWLIKIDTDQIYDANKLKESFKLPKTPRDIVYYFRINLHCFDNAILIDKNTPLYDPKDHWLICNNGLFFINSIVEEYEEKIFYWESLIIPFYHFWIDAPLNTWHFPFIKASRRNLALRENYIHISKYKEVIPSRYLKKITIDMLDERRILRYFKGEF